MMPIPVSPPASSPPVSSQARGRRTRTDDAVGRSVAYIHANFAERVSLEDLAAVADLSVFRFLAVFKAAVGVSPHRYLSRVRVARAQALLAAGMAPACVAMEVGFFDQSHLCRNFKTICGLTPGQYLSHARRDEAGVPLHPGLSADLPRLQPA